MNANRFLAFLLAASVSGCAARPGATTQNGLTPLARTPSSQRGAIDTLYRVTTFDRATLSKGLYGKVIDQLGGPPQCAVKVYSVTYETIGVNGEPANASAGLFVPDSKCKGPYPLVGYAHGTNLVKEQLISDPSTISKTWTPPDQDPVVVASVFAAHGYVAVATDYLGLGHSTYPYHPYLHAGSEASAVIDSLRAARLAAAKLNVPLTKTVFLTGHSQGGQSSVATQRAIEALGTHEFALHGDAPSSGPYALTQTFQDSLRNQSQDAPILAAYILTGYQKIYNNVYSSPTDVFKNPYANGIDALLPVQTYKDEAALIGKTLPLRLDKLLQPSFVTSFLNDPRSGGRKDAAQNDLLGGWVPKAPVFLCGGSRDPEVEFKNATAAYKYFTVRHANVQITDVDSLIPSQVPLKDYHVVVALFCLPLARVEFFDSLK